MSGAAPHELAALALAVLHMDVASRILQAAIAERAVDEDAFIKVQVLVFEDFAFEPIHEYRFQAERS